MKANMTETKAAQALADLLIWASTAPSVSSKDYRQALENLLPMLDKKLIGLTPMAIVHRTFQRAGENGDDPNMLADKIASTFVNTVLGGEDNDEQRS